MATNKKQKDKIMLLTCIDARYKYLQGLGDLSIFDAVIDITEITTKRKQYDFRPEFSDRLQDVIFSDHIIDLERVLKERLPQRAIVFAPPEDIERLRPIFNILKYYNVKCDLSINKNSAQNIIPFPKARWFARSLKSKLKRDKRLPVGSLYYSDWVFLPPWADKIVVGNFTKVRHIDAPRFESREGEYNLFLDSSFPFHKEFIARCGQMNPQIFYKRLCELAVKLKCHSGLERFIFALHPNSEGKEVAYLDGFEWHYGQTNALISGAAKVWSFGSDATGTAVCYGKPVEYVNFPDLLPDFMQRYICTKGDRMGIPVLNYDGKVIEIKKTSVFGKLVHRRRYKHSFGESSPTLSEALLR
ncbi:MAG: hypothetical protein ACQEXO_01990 [Pseudomonadota bacterium]